MQPHISVRGEKELGRVREERPIERERERDEARGRRELVFKPKGMCFSQRKRKKRSNERRHHSVQLGIIVCVVSTPVSREGGQFCFVTREDIDILISAYQF